MSRTDHHGQSDRTDSFAEHINGVEFRVTRRHHKIPTARVDIARQLRSETRITLPGLSKLANQATEQNTCPFAEPVCEELTTRTETPCANDTHQAPVEVTSPNEIEMDTRQNVHSTATVTAAQTIEFHMPSNLRFGERDMYRRLRQAKITHTDAVRAIENRRSNGGDTWDCWREQTSRRTARSLVDGPTR